MSWRDQILTEFTPQVAPLTLVADPDDLLSEEGVVQEIQQRGFEIITFEDAIAKLTAKAESHSAIFTNPSTVPAWNMVKQKTWSCW